MTVKWSDIKSKYDAIDTEEEAALGAFRERKVHLFKQHEGEETDKKVRGKPITVNAKSFAEEVNVPYTTFKGWVSTYETRMSKLDPEPAPEPACINDGVPPKESLIREVTRRLREALPLLSELSADTHTLIAEDLDDLKALIAEIESNLKERQW